MYVDDLQVYHSFKTSDINEATNTISNQCNKIQKWYCANDLLINTSKTQMIVIGQPKRVYKVKGSLKIEIDGSTLTPQTEIKNLGLIFDEQLNFSSSREQSVANKCAKLLYRTQRVRSLLTDNTTKKLIQSAVIQRLLYCAPILSSASKASIHQLQSVQTYAAKLYDKDYFTHDTRPIFKKLKWLRFEQMIKERTLHAAYKSMHGIHPQGLCEMFKKREDESSTGMTLRGRKTLDVPRSTYALTSNRYSVLASKYWNETGQAINSLSFTKFKAQFRSQMLREAEE